MTATPQQLDALAALDTPTVCNALELLVPKRRGHGFNRRPLVAPFPQMKPLVAYARTATIIGREKLQPRGADPRALRLAYYEYHDSGPRPSVAVIQDLDGPDRGIGAFWGEVQTAVHLGLGCMGVITDGSVRDIDQMAEGFMVLAGSIMPSHAHTDVVDFDKPVSVAGMVVHPGDLIHADRHGAVVVPHNMVDEVPKAAALIARREKVILDAARSGSFSMADLRRAFAEVAEIH